MCRSSSETWMFSVVFWILCSWLPCLAHWQVSCSRYVVQLQQNICHQNDCEHEWQSTFCPNRTWDPAAEKTVAQCYTHCRSGRKRITQRFIKELLDLTWLEPGLQCIKHGSVWLENTQPGWRPASKGDINCFHSFVNLYVCRNRACNSWPSNLVQL